MDELERFRRYFAARTKADPETGCLLWQGSTNKTDGSGYGTLKFLGKVKLAHHVAWFLRHGDWPPVSRRGKRRRVLMHRCDRKRCVNPDHLELGSDAQNARDAFLRVD